MDLHHRGPGVGVGRVSFHTAAQNWTPGKCVWMGLVFKVTQPLRPGGGALDLEGQSTRCHFQWRTLWIKCSRASRR